MGDGTLFEYWVLIFLGLLLGKRFGLRCHVLSAAIAAGIFIGISVGFSLLIIPVSQASDAIKAAYFFLMFGFVPLSSGMTLVIGKMLVPFFSIDRSDLVRCAAYLSTWFLVGAALVSIFKFFGILLLFALSKLHEEYYN